MGDHDMGYPISCLRYQDQDAIDSKNVLDT